MLQVVFFYCVFYFLFQKGWEVCGWGFIWKLFVWLNLVQVFSGVVGGIFFLEVGEVQEGEGFCEVFKLLIEFFF